MNVEKEIVELLHTEKMELLWYLMGEALRLYFRVDTTGQSYVPAQGAGVILPNHSGFTGLDVVVVAHMLRRLKKRQPKILAHRAYFDLFKAGRMVSESFGLRDASVKSGVKQLEQNELLMVFPEGERGNFKPSADSYKLQKFHTGAIRMAIKAKAPLIPSVVIGAEESNFNLGNIDVSKLIKNLVIPLPINLIPLPSKWSISFLKPIDLSAYTSEDADNRECMQELAQKIRKKMQQAINRRLKKREYIYIPPPKS